MQPANDLLSQREKNEAYLAARPGHAYALYFPTGGVVELKLAPAEPGRYTLHWIDVSTGEEVPGKEISAPGTLRLETPGQGGWVAVVAAGAN
jgi:hypothetical protein